MNVTKDSVFNEKFNIAGDAVDIKEYFSQFAKLLNPVEKCQEENCKSDVKEDSSCGSDSCKVDEFYRSFLGISQEELKELKDRTSIDHLTCDGELAVVPLEMYKKVNEEKIKESNNADQIKAQECLNTVKKRAELNVLKNELSRKFFKYCNYQWSVNEKQMKTSLVFESEDFSTVVACIKVYHPFLSYEVKNYNIKILQEIHILGNQTLSDLRDKIMCFLDYVGIEDVSNECYLKDVGLHLTQKESYPSSFIFIENTFYNDTRSSKYADLSKELREWARNQGLGSFESAVMENTKICDLKVKIGQPYVFQHQGSCEHVIVFSDIRFLEFSDPARLSAFPKTHCTGRSYGKRCMMCGGSYARWLVTGNERLTHDRAFLCSRCFFSYNYKKGQKIGQFLAYKYVDPIAIL